MNMIVTDGDLFKSSSIVNPKSLSKQQRDAIKMAFQAQVHAESADGTWIGMSPEIADPLVEVGLLYKQTRCINPESLFGPYILNEYQITDAGRYTAISM